MNVLWERQTVYVVLLASCFSSYAKAQQGLPARQTVEVGKGVYVATGFVSNNMGFIVTDQGVVVIDTGSSPDVGKAFLSEIRKATDRPIKYVIFTHYHYDHVDGAVAFKEEGTRFVAHENLPRNFNALRRLERVNRRGLGIETEAPAIYPDITYRDTLTLTVGKKEIRLIHIKAETDDATLVYVPEDKVLFIGDMNNQNLGSPVLPEGYPEGLVQAIDLIDELDVNVFVPGHGFMETTNMKSLEALKTVTTYLMSETKRHADDGLNLTETLAAVTMPEEFRRDEVLAKTFLACREPYINRLHKNYTGYYGRDPIMFAPASPKERGALIAELAGGNSKLLDMASRLLNEENFQLALETLDIVTTNEPENREARLLKEKAFMGLAGKTTHNWYRMVSYMNAARKEKEYCCKPD